MRHIHRVTRARDVAARGLPSAGAYVGLEKLLGDTIAVLQFALSAKRVKFGLFM